MMTDSGAAINPRVPTYKKEASYAPPSPAVLNGSVASSPDPAIPIVIRSIEESPPARRDTSSALIDAVQKVYAVVTAQIAYHEREASRLRESLKPFAAHAQRPNVAQENHASEAAIKAVLDLADQFNLGEKQP